MTLSDCSDITHLRGPVVLAHLFLRNFVRPGNKVVDATCGNGHDTLLLATLTGSAGHVWGFDIQQRAIVETARKLAEAGLDEQVTLLHSGHEELAKYLAVPVQVIVFNLGFLPGSDRSIITRPETTKLALQQSLELLSPCGIIVITIYPGHSGGGQEKNIVEGWAAALDARKYYSWRMGQLNVASDAPYCIIIQKAV